MATLASKDPKLNFRRENFRQEKSWGPVFIAATRADHRTSLDLLKKAGLTPLVPDGKSPVLALTIINEHPILKDILRGKWAYLGTDGLEGSGYHVFSENMSIRAGKGHPDKTAQLYPGNGPLTLYVANGFSLSGRRYVLGADHGPEVPASIVVGIDPALSDMHIKSTLRK